MISHRRPREVVELRQPKRRATWRRRGTRVRGSQLQSMAINGEAVRHARRELMGTHRRSQEITGAHRRSQELTGAHGSSRELTGAHESSQELTGARRSSQELAGAQGSSRELRGARGSSPAARRRASRRVRSRGFWPLPWSFGGSYACARPSLCKRDRPAASRSRRCGSPVNGRAGGGGQL